MYIHFTDNVYTKAYTYKWAAYVNMSYKTVI